MDLKGYKLPKKVLLVVSWRNQAFVVDPDTKGQLETAKNWARYWDRDLDKYIEGEIIETENEGFELEFQESADYSSQGGKLSFWDCKITKDGRSYIIGINQDLLLNLIKSCTIINGKVQDKCSFIKQKGNTGLVVKDSEFYKECIRDIELRNEKLSQKKTTIWEPGFYYESLTQEDMYLLDFYIWYKEEKLSWYDTKYTMLDKPIKRKLMVGKYTVDKRKTLSDIFKKDNALMYRFDYLSKEKLPPRSKSNSEEFVKIDLNSEDLERIRREQLNSFNETKSTHWLSFDSKIKLLLTSFDKNPPRLLDSDKEYLRNNKVEI